ncbi:Imm1 family immunity protein [Zavarzinella formosa]|uniref:Imm1 family immunity protein n=1 Tax=Zavarzinella formosa TaxID=360055 RepID=UPI00030E7E2A|nr:Imm1 family immunity protein [Zavarzinella formosa]
MAPTLHQWYSANDAIAAFGAGEPPESFCEGQFLVLPSVVLCFVTVGHADDGPDVSSPSNVAWRPKPGRTPVSEDDWLPEKVQDVWDRSGEKIRKLRDHHIFIRPTDDDLFFNAGEAHLGALANGRTSDGQPGWAAYFSLTHKLPREMWLKLGGYPGWLVEINHNSHRIAADDLTAFERLAGQLSSQEFSHLSMTRYEEDSLTVHTNASRGWLMYLRHPSDGGLYTRDLEYDGPPESEEVFLCGCGIDLEFSASRTIPRELAAQAALEFFQTGRLPQCVHWELEWR